MFGYLGGLFSFLVAARFVSSDLCALSNGVVALVVRILLVSLIEAELALDWFEARTYFEAPSATGGLGRDFIRTILNRLQSEDRGLSFGWLRDLFTR